MNNTSPQSLLLALHWIQQTSNLFTSELSPWFVDSVLPADFSLPYEHNPELALLTEQINQKGHLRLGIYYEYLWQFLISQHPQMKLLAHNLPVRTIEDNLKKTLGEFDLIYRYGHHIYHRELAVKFYLGVPNAFDSEFSTLNQWVGPGLKDRLDRKMKRMLSHQIVLGDQPHGLQTLYDIGVPSANKEIVMQGRLFYPWQEDCPAPQFSHPNHLRGIWMPVSAFKDWLKSSVKPFMQLQDKTQWVHNGKIECTSNVTCSELSSLKSPVYLLQGDQHLFIVPDQWYEQAKAFSKLSSSLIKGSETVTNSTAQVNQKTIFPAAEP